MKRLVLIAAVKMCVKAVLLTTVAATVIGVIGKINQWNTALAYSNAFFVAGALVIIAGTSSRLGAGAQWATFRSLSAESFRGMSSAEQADFIINTSNSVSLLVLCVLSGTLLIVISLLVAKLS